jgi:hypothetical protein
VRVHRYEKLAIPQTKSVNKSLDDNLQPLPPRVNINVNRPFHVHYLKVRLSNNQSLKIVSPMNMPTRPFTFNFILLHYFMSDHINIVLFITSKCTAVGSKNVELINMLFM